MTGEMYRRPLRPPRKAHDRTETVRRRYADEVETLDGRLKPARQQRRIVLASDRRAQAGVEQVEPIHRRVVAGCRNHVIGEQLDFIARSVVAAQAHTLTDGLRVANRVTDAHRNPAFNELADEPPSRRSEMPAHDAQAQ